jgi:hypothetical protein
VDNTCHAARAGVSTAVVPVTCASASLLSSYADLLAKHRAYYADGRVCSVGVRDRNLELVYLPTDWGHCICCGWLSPELDKAESGYSPR